MVLDEFDSLQREGVRVLDLLRNALQSIEIDPFTDHAPRLTLVTTPPGVYGKGAVCPTGTNVQRTGRLSPA
jgi:hypothetical protein